MNTVVNILTLVLQIILILSLIIANFSAPGKPYYELPGKETEPKNLGIWARDSSFGKFDAKLMVCRVFMILCFIIGSIMSYFIGSTISPGRIEYFFKLDNREKYLNDTCRLILLSIQFVCVLITTWVFSTVARIDKSYYPLNSMLAVFIISVTQCLVVLVNLVKLPELDHLGRIRGGVRWGFLIVLLLETLGLLLSAGCMAKVPVADDGKYQALEAMTLYAPYHGYRDWVYALFGIFEGFTIFVIVLICILLEVVNKERTLCLLFFVLAGVLINYEASMLLSWELTRSGMFEDPNMKTSTSYTALFISLVIFCMQNVILVITVGCVNSSANILPGNAAEKVKDEEYPFVSAKKSESAKEDPPAENEEEKPTPGQVNMNIQDEVDE